MTVFEILRMVSHSVQPMHKSVASPCSGLWDEDVYKECIKYKEHCKAN
jgi:hypothetical protein